MDAKQVVSICVPAYNAEETLRQTLDSLLMQRYGNCEIIVSDNYSKDSTQEIIRSYAARGIRYCKPDTAPDRLSGKPAYIGAYVNANYVAKQGTGEFVCLYHADDIFDPDIVSKQVALMQADPNVGAVFTMLRTIGADGRLIRRGGWQLPQELRGQRVFDFATIFNVILVHGNFLYTPSVMLRRSVLEQVGEFNEERFMTSADLEMFLRIAQQFSIGIIDEQLLNYRVSPKQGGAQYNRLRTTPADFFTVIDHYLAQPPVREVVSAESLASYEFLRSVDQITCATNLMMQGNVKAAQPLLHSALQTQHFVTGFRLRSKRLVRLMAGAGLLTGSSLGFGPPVARSLHQFEQRRERKLRTPIN